MGQDIEGQLEFFGQTDKEELVKGCAPVVTIVMAPQDIAEVVLAGEHELLEGNPWIVMPDVG